MPTEQALANFHFDAQKSAKILKEWVKESGMPYQRVAEVTGYSYDTINNSLAGRISEISLERVFKIATCTGHSVTEFLAISLQGTDAAFAPDAALITAQNVPHTGKEQDAEDGHAVPGVLDRFKALYLRMIDQMRDQHEAEKQTIMSSLTKTLEAKDDMIARQDRQIKSLTRKSTVLSIIITLETVFIAVMLAVDVLNPSRGWIVRSLFDFGRTSILRKG